MAQQTPGVWGVDVGQFGLKAIRLERQDGGQVVATAFDYVEHPKILSQPDADPDALTREALAQFLQRNDLKGDTLSIGVPSQSGLARFVKLPPVEEKKIPEIVKFEAKQQIPFPLDEVVWDYQKVGAGVVTDGFAMETEVGLFAMKRDMISRSLGHFQAVGAEVDYVQMVPLALVNFASYELLKKDPPAPEVKAKGKKKKGKKGEAEEAPAPPPPPTRGKKKCVVVLDVGTDASYVVVTDGERVIWQRAIAMGGNNFTKALSKEMKLTFAKAEHVKRNAATSPDLAKILKAIKPVLSDFVGEIQRSLGFFTNMHRDAEVQFMVGVGSALRLPGLQKYISEKLSLEVKKPSKFERISGDEVLKDQQFSENLLSFTVAYGLALQGLDLAKIQTNLLPPEIGVERKIRDKKPWAAAAAAAILLGCSVWAIGAGANYASKTADEIETARKQALGRAQASASQNQQISTTEGEINTTVNDLQALIAGQKAKANWLGLNRYVLRNLPVPGPKGNLLSNGRRGGGPNQVRYWNPIDAREAFANYQRRITEGVRGRRGIPEMYNNLPVVDLHAVETRYTDNLKQFFDTAKAASKTESGQELLWMSTRDKSNPPDGAGWVVEVRGLTYYNERIFLNDCLIWNLQNDVGAKDFPLPKSEDDKPAKDEGGNNQVPIPAAGGPTAGTPEGPLKGQVSHVFMFKVVQVRSPVAGSFQLIDKSFINDLVYASPAAGGRTGEGQEGGAGGGSAAAIYRNEGGSGATTAAGGTPQDWAPIGENAASGTAGGAGRGGEGREGVAGSGGGGAGVTARFPRGNGNTGRPAAEAGGGTLPQRYEFIVYFIWREPNVEAESDAAASGS